jgi:hypothetical protein
MKELGFGTERVNDTLKESKLLLSQENYLGAESLANHILTLKEAAIKVDSLIDNTEERIFELEADGLDISPAKDLFEQALDAFSNERYEEAESLLQQAIETMEDIEAAAARQSLDKDNSIAGLFYKNPGSVATFIVFILILIFVLFYTRKYLKNKKNLSSLKQEKTALEKSIKTLQKKYFEESKIPKNEYRQSMTNYERKLQQVKKDIITITHEKSMKV